MSDRIETLIEDEVALTEMVSRLKARINMDTRTISLRKPRKTKTAFTPTKEQKDLIGGVL